MKLNVQFSKNVMFYWMLEWSRSCKQSENIDRGKVKDEFKTARLGSAWRTTEERTKWTWITEAKNPTWKGKTGTSRSLRSREIKGNRRVCCSKWNYEEMMALSLLALHAYNSTKSDEDHMVFWYQRVVISKGPWPSITNG